VHINKDEMKVQEIQAEQEKLSQFIWSMINSYLKVFQAKDDFSNLLFYEENGEAIISRRRPNLHVLLRLSKTQTLVLNQFHCAGISNVGVWRYDQGDY